MSTELILGLVNSILIPLVAWMLKSAKTKHDKYEKRHEDQQKFNAHVTKQFSDRDLAMVKLTSELTSLVTDAKEKLNSDLNKGFNVIRDNYVKKEDYKEDKEEIHEKLDEVVSTQKVNSEKTEKINLGITKILTKLELE